MKKHIYTVRLIIAIAIFALFIVAVFGFYPIHFLNLELSALIVKNLHSASVFALILLSVVTILTLIFGRCYCSSICPLGTFQELILLATSKIYSILKKQYKSSKIYEYKYFLLMIVIGLLIGGSIWGLKYFDPYTIITSAISGRIYSIIVVILITALVIWKKRFFCSNICPIGVIVGFISKFSIFKTYINEKCVKCANCYRNCPTGAINLKEQKVDNEVCIKCMKCVSVCDKNAMCYGIKPKPEIKFNPTKRNAIKTLSLSAVFVGAIIAGVKFTKNSIDKISTLILPAGAKSSKEFKSKCLNCNLCVLNCPNKILRKADKLYPAPHIDYSKGERHCSFYCNKCSQVCPSGAIQKISLENKQKTKIATAKVSSNCMSCSSCVRKCPVGAMTFVDYMPVVDENKCIGCGMCKSVCPVGAISIVGIEEQRKV
ncbi:4Fe-4S binding protein [bacterium]|nr:4Fe-4S binding protein [bacterium]